MSQTHGKFSIIEPSEKAEQNILPYLTIPLIKICTQKCVYCGDGAEMTLSEKRQFSTDDILAWHAAARLKGIEKFRLTGGEPLIHTDFNRIMRTIAADAGFVLVNTNATLHAKFRERWIDSPMNVRYVVNYHGASEAVYDTVSGTKGYYHTARAAIEELAERGMLHRLNAVVNRHNIHEIWDIIAYCRHLGVDLKIQDVVSVPWSFNEWNDVYVDSRELERQFEERASRVRDHRYAKAFGTPTKIYTIDGVNITLKSVRSGAQYDAEGVCKTCPFFPCHEGVYDIFAFADNSLWACNWTKIASISQGERADKLQYMIDLFQRATYAPAGVRLQTMERLAAEAAPDQKLEFVGP